MPNYKKFTENTSNKFLGQPSPTVNEEGPLFSEVRHSDPLLLSTTMARMLRPNSRVCSSCTRLL